jgi:hypothetical protein
MNLRNAFPLALSIAAVAATPASAAEGFLPGVDPVSDGPELAQTAGDHALGASGAGELFALWGSNTKMRLAGASPLGTFGSPFDLADGAGTSLPDIAVAPNGRAVAVWRDDAGVEQVFAAVRPPGGSFGEPFQVSVETESNPSVDPHVDVDDSGAALVVWKGMDDDTDQTTMRIKHRRIDANGVPGPQLGFLTGQNRNHPDVAVGPAGDAVVTFVDHSTGNDPGTIWISADGATYDTETFNLNNGIRPLAAVDAEGRSIAAYPSGANMGARYRPAGNAANFGAGESIDGADGDPNGRPAISMDAAGNATIVFALEDGGGLHSMRTAFRPVGDATEFTDDVPIDTPSVGERENVSLAVNPAGAALAGWTSLAETTAHAAARKAGAAAFGAPTPALTPAGHQTGETNAAIADNGSGAVALTSSSDGNHYAISAARYRVTQDPPAQPGPGVVPPPGADKRAPRLTKLSLSRKRFRAGKGRGRGTRFRFRLDELATVQVRIERRKGKRWVKVGTFNRKGVKPGKRSFVFRGKLGRRTLTPRGYRAVVTAIDKAKNRSKPARVKFVVKRR